MARVICNGRLYDVWDNEYQELVVEGYAHIAQTFPTIDCEDIFPSALDRMGDLSRFLIK